MKSLKFLLVVVLIALPFYVFAQTPNPMSAPSYENVDSPVDLLASYYNAINRKEYARAYSYWETAPNSYADFVAGFASTVDVQLIVQPPTSGEGAAGSIYVQIPTVLIADHQDGTQYVYSGCFVTRKSNLQPPDIPEPDVWHLFSADILPVSNDLSKIPSLLKEACQSS